MTPIITDLSGSSTVDAEELTLGGLALHESPFRVQGFEHTPSKKLFEWVRGADSDGSKLLRMPKHENATVTLKIRADRQASMDSAINRIGQIVDRVQEAERQAAGGLGRGLALTWTPMGSTFTGTIYVLGGEVEVPKELSGDDMGYSSSVRRPVILVTLHCDPFIYGSEVTSATTTSTLPLLTATVEDVAGDVAAEARFIVTDGATQNRDYVAIGLQNANYDPTTSLLYATSNMVYTGFAGSPDTRSGSYSGSTLRATLTTTPVAVCSSAELTHKGTFRNVFRLWPSSTGVSVRLAWRQGRDQWTTEPWATAPFEDTFWEVDLGQSKIREALLGTQTWQWRIEAKSTAAGDTLDVDFHAMIPSGEGYGKARKVFLYETPVAFLDQDSFGGMTAGNALNARAAPIGGDTWATSGSAPDFVAKDGPGSSDETVGRTGASEGGRLAILATHTNAAMEIRFQYSKVMAGGARTILYGRRSGSADIEMELIAGSPGNFTLAQTTSGGTYSTLAIAPLVTMSANVWYRMLLIANGATITGYLLTDQGTVLTTATATTTTTASGTWGFGDANGAATAINRYYTDFSIYTPTTEATIFSGQSLEFRSYGEDFALREDSTGTYWGRPPGETRGGRIELPPAGDEDRVTRVAVMARRADIETRPSANVGDSLSLQIKHIPRWVTIPREAA